MAGELPSCRPAISPIVAWAEACVDATVNRNDLEIAWRAAIMTVAAAKGPVGAAKGPTGAAIAAALRLGWKMPGWHVLVEQAGYILDLCEEAPVTVTRAATEAYARWSAVGSSVAARIGGPPALDAL